MKFLVLDGNSILNRAFYGIRMLSNKKGQMTNGIYGFLTTLQKLLNEVSPDAVAIAFDLPFPTFRHKMYNGYKATRKKMPEELASQMPILKELLSAMGYKLVSCEGYEADDILGTFANYCEKKNYDCVLATGDKDSLQLISEKVTVRIATTKFGKAEAILYDESKIKEDYGFAPLQLIDLKALQGDTSDNIPGVQGIGEKTAKSLICQFGSLDNIYENIESLDIRESVKNKLQLGKENAYLSYTLGTINKNVPLEFYDDDYIPKPPEAVKVKKIMTELEFFSLLDKMSLNIDTDNRDKIFIDYANDAKDIIEKIKAQKYVSFSLIAPNLYINKIFLKIQDKIYALDSSYKEFIEFLKDFASLEDVEKITYDIKKVHRIFGKYGIDFRGKIFDIMLASYLLSPSSSNYDVHKIAGEYEILAPNVSCSEKDNQNGAEIATEVYLYEKLLNPLKEQLSERKQLSLLLEIEQPLSKVLADMENTGFAVDKNGLKKYSENLQSQISDAQNYIYKLADSEFNINSPKQLGTILFEKMGLPKGKKGKTGYSTSAETLEKLKGYHEIIDAILEYRALSKLKSTYCDGMIKLITAEERIHSSFNQTETRTGRISSTEPNLQNIPVRTQRGRELRKFFKAKPGHVLIDADYSQIELRVLAHIAGDDNMISAFNNNEDIHALTASQIFNLPLEMVTQDMRFKAKAVNFGIIYGMGAFSLSQDLKISRYEAQKYIDRYLNHYKQVNYYMQEVIDAAKNQGYVETMLNRRRYLPELASSNHTLRSFGERVARNMPIQGSAADIIKIAMINTYNKLKERKLNSKLILQVHDELIIESTLDEANEVKNLLKYEMENAVEMTVPLKVNIAVGETWFDAKN